MPGPSSREKLRVVTLVDHPALGGGAERVALDLTTHLDAERFARTLCISRWEPEELDAARLAAFTGTLERARVELVTLRRGGRLDLRAWVPLLRLLRERRVDVLHAHKFGQNAWAAVLGRLAGVPVIVAHEHTWSYEGRPLRRALDRHLIARACAAFVAVSREDARRMVEIERVPRDRIVVLPNGIVPAPPAAVDGTVRAGLGIAADAPVVGVVALQRPQKRVDLLVRAAGRLAGEFPGLQVLLIGGGPPAERARVEALVDELGLGGVVRPLGPRRDVPDLLEALDVAVSSSDFEGSPLAVLEYMEAGLPIVATAVGGVPGLIEDGRHGLLVAPGDDEALADGIRRMLRDREAALRMGEAARRRRRAEFDLDAIAVRLEGLYEHLLVRRGRVRPVLEPIESPAAARGEWEALAERDGSPFATWAWHDAWWRHFGAGSLRLLRCRRAGGETAAVLPLHVVRRGPLRVARFLGHGPGDELGPVCAPEDRGFALAALRVALDRGELGADVLLAERVAADQELGTSLGGRVLNAEASPALDLEGLTWEAFLAARSRNFREQVRRRERALAREHELRFRLCDDPARLDEDMSTLIALHRARWGSESGAFEGGREAFHRELAATALAEGWLRLWLLEADGQAVAAWHGFRRAGREFYYQAGRDPEWERRSVGFVLMNHTIRAAIEDGMREYRLLRGDEGYKSRFATRDRPLETRAVGRGPLGRPAVAAAARGVASPKVRERVKRFS